MDELETCRYVYKKDLRGENCAALKCALMFWRYKQDDKIPCNYHLPLHPDRLVPKRMLNVTLLDLTGIVR